jgi:hypothetical protein
MPSICLEDDSEAEEGEEGDQVSADAFISAAELKRSATNQVAGAVPEGEVSNEPIEGFAWYSPFAERAREREKALTRQVVQQNKPYYQPPYCYLCDSFDDGSNSNPHRTSALLLIDLMLKMDLDEVVKNVYKSYRKNTYPLTRREWPAETIAEHILIHDPKPLHLMCHRERILNRLVQARVQKGGGLDAKSENQIIKTIRLGLQVTETKRRMLKETEGNGALVGKG